MQYADIPDGTSFHGVPRYYRNALVALQRAVSSGWVPAGVEFGIHFGDIVDGFQARDGQVCRHASVSVVCVNVPRQQLCNLQLCNLMMMMMLVLLVALAPALLYFTRQNPLAAGEALVYLPCLFSNTHQRMHPAHCCCICCCSACLQEKSEQALSDVLQAFSQLPHPTYHMLGNHCLYNLPRARLNKRLGITPLLDPAAAAEGASYYAFSPHPTWLFVVLDAYDVSLLGWPDSHPRHLQAEALLAQHNPNKVRLLELICVGAAGLLCGRR